MNRIPKDSVAVITGGGRGIGLSIAKRFARDGVKIVLLDWSKDLLQTAEQELKAFGCDLLTVQADVSEKSSVDRAIQATLERFKTVDILVNNAGIVRDATLLKMKEEDFDQVIDVNLKGVFLCTQACAKIMAEKNKGAIVSISSIARRGNFGQTNYSASKAGVVGMTKTWALELSKLGIRVNAIAPGFISTEMTQTIPLEIQNKLIAKIPLNRAGDVDDIASLVHFLASDGASYIQGEVIEINGGYQM